MDDDNLVAAAKLAEEQQKESDTKDDEGTDETPSSETEETTSPSEGETPEAPSDTGEEDQPTEEATEEKTDADTAEETPSEEATTETRKDRREARKQDFLERKRYLDSIRKDTPTESVSATKPDYDPIDYTKPPEDGEFDPTELVKDREAYGKAKAAEAAEAERFRSAQEKFWESVSSEHKLLVKEDQFKYLDQESDDFDPDRAADLNERYLATVGYTEIPRKDANGAPITDATGQPVIDRLVRDPSISFEKYARLEQQRLDAYAEAKLAEAKKNLTTQSAQSGVRPSGTRKGPQITSASDIAKMSPEDFEKHKEQIEAQALKMLEE